MDWATLVNKIGATVTSEYEHGRGVVDQRIVVQWNDAIGEPISVDVVVDVQTGEPFYRVVVATAGVTSDCLRTRAEVAEETLHES